MKQTPWFSPDLFPEHKDQGYWAMMDKGQPVRSTLETIVERMKQGLGQAPSSGQSNSVLPALVAAPDSPRFFPVYDRPELRDLLLKNHANGDVRTNMELLTAVVLTVFAVMFGIGEGSWFGVSTIFAIWYWTEAAVGLHFMYVRERSPDVVAMDMRKEMLFDHWTANCSMGHRSRSKWMAAGLVLVLAAQLLSAGIDPRGAGYLGIERMGLDKTLWQSEPWRLVTAVVMHGGFIHFFLSLVCLLTLITTLDATRARWWGPFIWLIGAAGGSLASAQVESYSVVGTSGGLVALTVFIIMTAWQDRRGLPRSFLRRLWANILMIALIGVIGSGYIDYATYFGGGFIGLVIGICFRFSGESLWSANVPRGAPAMSRLADVLLVMIILLTTYLLLMPVSVAS